MIPLLWPDGTYGLPQPKTGCPKGAGFNFLHGWRKHDTEDGKNLHIAIKKHLRGNLPCDITRYFCMKRLRKANIHFRRPDWPSGRYCIYKKGHCPQGFKSGFLFWDDEDTWNTNDAGGSLPDGVYNRNTKIYYCCRNDSNHETPILLPFTDPFYLIRIGGKCQEVFGMNVIDGWLQWDDENFRNRDSRGPPGGLYPDTRIPDHRVHFCYYF